MSMISAAGTTILPRFAVTLLVTGLTFGPVWAQLGPPGGMGGPPTPQLSGSLTKLFEQHPAFTAVLTLQTKDPQTGGTLTIPGQIAFDAGKARFEMDLTKMQGGRITPEAGSQMKAMGMDKMIMISRPDKQVAYMVYPGLKGYVESELQNSDAASPDDYKLDFTELGKETVDGRRTVKNRAVLTDKQGTQHTATVWKATELKNFPVKIEHTEGGQSVILRFSDIKLAKPEPLSFDPPAGFTRHGSMMAMMQEVIMKQMSGGQALPSSRR
jgi:hypothetical protein